MLNSYGYNVWGVGFNLDPYGLGLGGRTIISPPPAARLRRRSTERHDRNRRQLYASGYLYGTNSLSGDQPWIGSNLPGGDVIVPERRWGARCCAAPSRQS